MAEEWWPELGPKWEPTAATKPNTVTIDAHCHIGVESSAELAKSFFKPDMDPRSFFFPPESIRYNKELRATQKEKFYGIEERLGDMDKMGIDMQLLSIIPPQYFYWLDAENGVKACRLQHERFAEIIEQHPTRFAAIGNIPMDHPDTAVEVMTEMKNEFGFNGFEISGDVNGADFDDRRFDPIWAKVVELDLTIIMHPQGFTDGQRMDNYYLINVVCMPLASTVAVSRMILGGVWERFPDLKMMVAHGGGYLPFYFARTDHAYSVRPEMRKHINRKPSEYLHNLYFDTVVFDPGMVEYLVAEFGEGHVLMGTDYPFDMGPTDPLAFLAETALTERARQLVVGGNAARLFKIQTP